MSFIYNRSIKFYATGCVKICNNKWLKQDKVLSSLQRMEVKIQDCGVRNASISTAFNVELHGYSL